MKKLFNFGGFKLHSGGISDFKIDCDALTDGDWESVAELIASKIKFYEVIPIPTGGQKLANLLRHYKDANSAVILIVDDVLTTGKSMEEMRNKLPRSSDVAGVVVFSRIEPPYWIHPIFIANSSFIA